MIRLLSFFIFYSSISLATLPGYQYDFLKAKASHGIDPKEVGEFWKDWHAVTTRYRKDNGEQRFVWANDLAWSALQKNSKNYPDGAMFAKLGFATVADPAFPNSLIPGVVSRIQLMKKDSKIKDTNGWSYGLYLGTSLNGDVESIKDQHTCHACHSIVKDRDYVFSVSMFGSEQKHFDASFSDKFKKINIEDLTPYAQAVLKNFYSEKLVYVSYLSMPLFEGSLEESIGPMSEYTTKAKNPYLLVDEKNHMFLLAMALGGIKDCTNSARVVSPGGFQGKRIWRVGNVCNGENKWIARKDVPESIVDLFKKEKIK